VSPPADAAPDGVPAEAGSGSAGADPADGGLAPSRGLSPPDRALYALFAGRADADRHALDRKRYRATNLSTGFDVYLARVYGASWLLGIAVAVAAAALVAALPAGVLEAAAGFAGGVVPASAPDVTVPRPWLAVGVGVAAGVGAKAATVRAGGLYLRWVAAARRTDIEGTLPGAVRYLHALSTGSDGARGMLETAAGNDAYGETAASFRTALNTARLTGSLDAGLRRVARDTPSRELLAPFLLKFREHAAQGEDALADYLRLESRMLSHRQDRARERAEGFLELVAELFIVLLVLPSLLVIVLTVMSVLAPGLSEPIHTPLGSITTRAAIVYGSAAFVAGVGAFAAATVASLRPADQRTVHRRPPGALATLSTAARNPASAAVACLPLAAAVAAGLQVAGVRAVNVPLLAYAAYAVPVGAVAVRRARIDDAKDREIKDFVHAVSGHVSLGRPFPEAVELVARDVDLGALNADVADLAFNLGLTTGDGSAADADDGGGVTDRRTAALDRFVDRVGTPLAEQTVGLVSAALEAGSDSGAVFETLQTEIGRLYHEKRALRSAMLVYVAVGWTTALLVIGIVVAVNEHVIEGFAQLSAVSGTSGFALQPGAVDPAVERIRFYVVTQATMLASGWFAGTASRGRYEALLHSGLLVTVCYVVFAGVGIV